MLTPTRAAGLAIVAVAAAGAPSAAAARNAVYGGSTSAGAPIVITADKKAKALRSAVVSWKAACDDGMRFPVAAPLEAVKSEPGFRPGARELSTSKNGKGRFAGTQVGAMSLGDHVGILAAKYAGKLSPKRARGTLDATITIIERASGSAVATCRTGSVRWSATRSPGRVFAGSTGQDHPVVLRVDAKRRAVTNLLFGWESGTCKPEEAYLFVEESFSDFPLGQGRFGDAFNQTFTPDGGGEGKVAYDITGRVARTRASGTFRVGLTETDPAGTITTACDSGTVSWSAATG
jgi:hypothetical protein